MSVSSSEFLRFSSRWSWMTWANSDGVSTGMGTSRSGCVSEPRSLPPFAALLSIADRLLGGDHTVLARALRLVERSVRGLDEGLLRAVVRMGGDAEARGDRDPRPVRGEDETLLESDAHALGEPCAALGVGRRQDQDELLAAPAARRVHPARGL